MQATEKISYMSANDKKSFRVNWPPPETRNICTRCEGGGGRVLEQVFKSIFV